jgi:hypothetical protein
VRLSTGLTWIVLAGVAVAIYRDPQLKTLPATWLTEAQQMITSHQATQSSDQTADTTSSTTSSSASSSTSTSSTTASSDATPIESNVQGKTLATTYYYHFKDNVPTAVRQEFERAVATYNQTGIVKLVAGTGTTKQNQITFFVYHKAVNQQTAQTIELGYGGPNIIEQTGWGAYTANHAKAGINVDYSASIKQSVATHELGHALGLDHSTSTTSVMYPVDQGVTTLSTADINALKSIYQN